MSKKEKQFKILVPLTKKEDVQVLKKAGADELYCGYVTKKYDKRWPIAFNTLNRRGEGQSFESYRDLKIASLKAEKLNLPIFITINGLYTEEQYPQVLEIVSRLEQTPGITGLIVADFALLLLLKKRKFQKKIHISTGGVCLNSMTADFFYNLGADSITLPRQLTVEETIAIVRKAQGNICFDKFILSEPCGGFLDGLCSFFHCFEKTDMENNRVAENIILQDLYNIEQYDRGCRFYFKEKLKVGKFEICKLGSGIENIGNLKFQLNKYTSAGCDLCALYKLKDYNVTGLKIVGRGKEVSQVVNMIKIVSQAISFLKESSDEKQYRKKCRNLMYADFFEKERHCSKYDCYFSSHWIK